MVFPSIEFAVFFPPVLLLSWLLMPRPWAWKPFILFCSYVFYAAANPKFCLLLAGVTLGNQLGAYFVTRTDSERRKNWICGITVALGNSHDYQLVAVHSGKCVDVSTISTAPGALVHQWTCDTGSTLTTKRNQIWRLLGKS